MKKILFHSVRLLIIVPILMACTDVLDQRAVDALNEEAVFSDINLAKAYLGTCYDFIDGTSDKGENGCFLGLNKDLLSSATDETFCMQRPKNFAFFTGTLSPDFLGIFGNQFFRYIQWGPLYQNVKNVNVFLANIDNVPVNLESEELLKKRMKAEAYFIRAFTYTNLMRTYGGLIILDKPFGMNDDFLTIQRSSLDETVAFILKDVDEAIKGLPLKNDIEQGRATKGAAAALKSRVLSWCTGELMNGGYEPSDPLVSFQTGTREARLKAAKQFAKEIMNGMYGHYTLTGTTDDPPVNITDEDVKAYENNFTSIFVQKGKWNDEVMWGLQSLPLTGKIVAQNKWWGPNGYHNFGNNNPTEEMVRLFEMNDGSPFVWDKYTPGNKNLRSFTKAQLEEDPERNPYVGREPRFYASILFDGAKWQKRPDDMIALDPEGRIQTGYFKDLIANKTTAGLDTRQATTESWNGSKTAYYIKKYQDESIQGQYFNNESTWIEFRYAEVIMDYAEACIELGEIEEGINALNMIRNRAGLPDRITTDQTQARNWYRKERQLEFFGEGDRWWMIRKWMIADKIIVNTSQMLVTHFSDGSKEWKYDVKTTVDKRAWQHTAYWAPIPRVEMNKAPQLQQNPGYEDKK